MNGYHAEKILNPQKLTLNFDGQDFVQRGKKKRPVVTSPK